MLPDYLSDDDLDDLIRRALREDVGPGDVTTEATVPPGTRAAARLLAKEDGIVAGLYVARRVFSHVDDALDVDWKVSDGARVRPGDEVGRVEGQARSILVGERLALNLMQRMSGIATLTHRMVERARPHGAEILDTRKTAPGLRALDKWAVRLGGGTNHRLGLYDRILIKDNHIDAAGGVAQALEAAHAYRQAHEPDLLIEAEARSLAEVDAILATGHADILLLDNFARRDAEGHLDTSLLEAAVRRIGGQARTEASGNVTLATVEHIARTGVDAISSGALTHSVRALDLSLKIVVASS